jgi:hypothetical protein
MERSNMKIDLKLQWLTAGNDQPEYLKTMTMLELCIGDTKLTQNEDIWSQTIRNDVLVSAYPLALWMASSWWRLNWEPLPANNIGPTTDWRMAHELGAANHGFVWPQIMFASDCDIMQVWAVPSVATSNQSVRYLNGLNEPAHISLGDFRNSISEFIEKTISRLAATGIHDCDLVQLWNAVKEELADPESTRYRRIEAEMGFDPDECPDDAMQLALELDKVIGTSTLTELAPIYGKTSKGTSLTLIEKMATCDGIIGIPQSEILIKRSNKVAGQAPWKQAVDDARTLRETINNKADPVDITTIYDLLGLNQKNVEQWSPPSRNDVGVAVPGNGREFKFLPRKKHPIARRFELSRFLADYMLSGTSDIKWLTSTDLGTARQKYQRAFAAEFLCPIHGLRNYLQDDFRESALEDAAEAFEVSPETVSSLLANNGLISNFGKYAGPRLPYQPAY